MHLAMAREDFDTGDTELTNFSEEFWECHNTSRPQIVSIVLRASLSTFWRTNIQHSRI